MRPGPRASSATAIPLCALLLWCGAVLSPRAARAADCRQAVERYNAGTAAVDPPVKERELRAALALCRDPQVASRVLNNLADLYEMQGDPARALRFYRESLREAPDFVYSLIGSGDVFAGLGDFYSAAIVYDRALALSPEDVELQAARRRAEEGRRTRVTLYFERGSAVLSGEYRSRLEFVGRALAGAGGARVEVVGHTCDLGPSSYNQRLSAARAAAVAESLAKEHAVPPSRISVAARGEDAPLLRGTSHEARTLNRRVEVVIHGAE